LKHEIYKSNFTPGFNTHLGDHFMSGAAMWRPVQPLPEPWFEYFYHEAWLHFMMPHEAVFDVHGQGYNRDYLHH